MLTWVLTKGTVRILIPGQPIVRRMAVHLTIWSHSTKPRKKNQV